MHECASIILNSFHLFQQTLFNKEFIVEGEEGVLKERVKTDRGRGEESNLSLCSLCEKMAGFPNSK